MPGRVVFDNRPPLHVRSLRGMPLVSLFTRAHSDTLFCAVGGYPSFPTHPPQEGGRASSRRSCPSGPLIYLSTLPGPSSINPIYPHSQLLTPAPSSLLLCKVSGLLGGQTPSGPVAAATWGGEQQLRGGKQSQRKLTQQNLFCKIFEEILVFSKYFAKKCVRQEQMREVVFKKVLLLKN